MDLQGGVLSGLDDNFFLTAQRESEALKERLLELYLLYTTSRTCSTAMQTGSLFVNIVDLLKNTLQVEEFCLMLEDPETGLYEMWTADERVMAQAGDCSFRPGEGIAGLVVQSGEAMMIQDVSLEPRFLNYKGLLPDIGAFLSVPLTAHDGRVFGVLNIHRSKPGTFREQDKDFFRAVAHNLAAALERARLFDQARKEAMHDGLTGLYNRRYLQDCGERELHKAQRQQEPLSLLMMDLDHFKEINDNWGHARGDQVLRELAELLKKNLRQTDLAARYGGEEFVVLLPDTVMADARALAEKLRAAIERELVLSDDGEQRDDSEQRIVTTTIGVSTFPADGDDLEELMAVADQRLYLGKAAGRNQVLGEEVASAAAADPSDRRRYQRRRTAWRVVRDSADCGKDLHSIDIRHGEEWIPCALMDVSCRGFNGMVYFPPKLGAQYHCRAVMGARNGRFRDFAVQVRHVELLDERQYLMGVRVGDQDVRDWKKLYSSLTR